MAKKCASRMPGSVGYQQIVVNFEQRNISSDMKVTTKRCYTRFMASFACRGVTSRASKSRLFRRCPPTGLFSPSAGARCIGDKSDPS